MKHLNSIKKFFMGDLEILYIGWRGAIWLISWIALYIGFENTKDGYHQYIYEFIFTLLFYITYMLGRADAFHYVAKWMSKHLHDK